MEGLPIDVEAHVAPGLPMFTVVGLPDAAIQESRERVRAAFGAAGEQWPQQRLTVNLSPAHLPKTGSGFDLPIALAVLAATGRIGAERLQQCCAVGELALSGNVQPIRGALAVVAAAASRGVTRILVPTGNAAEAALVDGVEVVPIASLQQAVRYLRGECLIDATDRCDEEYAPAEDVDLSEVKGQLLAKRALEIAAAGGHNMLMDGAPGGGKTMLARRLSSILPPLERDEAMAVTRLYSVAGLLPEGKGLIRTRPFRAPHHSISVAGLVGGGSGIPSPGEVSLAHRGVLFLDETAEFRRDALQSLRQPIEDGSVVLSRARYTVRYPCRFMLVLAKNPCPCGFLGDYGRSCECAPGRLVAYKERLSGPLLDRIDLSTKVSRVKAKELFDAPTEASGKVRERVMQARARQRDRLRLYGVSTNADIPPRFLGPACAFDDAAYGQLRRVQEQHKMSMRTTHRVMRVARTIADLESVETADSGHLNEAVALRMP